MNEGDGVIVKSIKIKNRIIGEGHPSYIIAEISANHAGSINRAKEIILIAKECGADCVKLQTYTPDTITINCNNEYFQINRGTWSGENLYQLYEKAYTPWEWHKELKDVADRIGIDIFSTPFDRTSVDFLEGIGMEFYKIASFELVDIPLIRYIASKGKPIIMSTGMGSVDEIEEAINTVYSQGINQLAILKCSSAYPAIPSDMNLKTIQNMYKTFQLPVGFSDHSMGSIAAVTAVALGACIIEKHLCLSRDVENPDSSFSMEPKEFKQMIEDIRSAEKAIGNVSYDISEKENENRCFRKSVFVVNDIIKGEKFTEENIRVIRPGYGIKPRYYNDILGQVALMDIKRGTPLLFNMVGTGEN